MIFTIERYFAIATVEGPDLDWLPVSVELKSSIREKVSRVFDDTPEQVRDLRIELSDQEAEVLAWAMTNCATEGLPRKQREMIEGLNQTLIGQWESEWATA